MDNDTDPHHLLSKPKKNEKYKKISMGKTTNTKNPKKRQENDGQQQCKINIETQES